MRLQQNFCSFAKMNHSIGLKRTWIIFLWTVLFGSACLPNPQSVEERRTQFTRDSLRGHFLLDELPKGVEIVNAQFAPSGSSELVRLLGYTLEPKSPKPGEQLEVTMYWSTDSQISEDYTVFVHGDAINGKSSRIHGDHYLAKGKYPTDVWQPGEVVVDPFKMKIPAGYGSNRLGLYVGLYKELYRMPLVDGGKRSKTSDDRLLMVELQF